MNKEQVKELALKSGFKLKEQPDGEMDLNPYVYKFARNLLEMALQPDTFWNEDGDTCFDSPEEAFQYYLDVDSQVGETMKLRQGISLPDAEYKMTKIDDESGSVECVLV